MVHCPVQVYNSRITLAKTCLQKRVSALQQSQANALSRPSLQYRSFRQSAREIGETIVLVALIYALVNLASARFVVDGPSMQPNFATGQYVIVSRVNYLLTDPQHGDVVVFNYPGDPTQDYIKRVIGVPGDTVEIRDTHVFVNGLELTEPYINEPCSTGMCRNDRWTLGSDQFFMMGDNRNHSSDSRAFGPVARHFIVGKALIRYWPPQDWGIIRSYTG
ncbi:MAG: signal peptidase I [Chloroflexi bacterium]|nr:signal peptidase I [Chloroflexota bacterium]